MSALASPIVDSEIERSRDPITLTRFLNAERLKYKNATGNFSMLLQSVQLACKVISSYTRKAGIANVHGVAGTENATGDVQKKLDVLANDVMVNCVRFSDQVSVIGSEENDEPIIVENTTGGYAIVFDPLDGSSNIDCNLSVGTIFGIYRRQESKDGKASLSDLLRPGSELIAAGFAVYDAATMIVLTTGHGVNGFTLDPSLGEFVITHKNIRIPKRGKIYSINEANSNSWDAAITSFVANCKRKGYSSRYVGSMCGDVHRTLLYGGIFMYPADTKNANGKLRLLYECNPVSFIVEQAGGRSTTGKERILDIHPKGLHQRCPIICGSPEDVAEVEALYKTLESGTVKSKL